ncbi:MAG: Uma2 family endonuclease [Selenomonadaceae bacterium]|nr:Uma2 family endonuclease [Selenomonadaceae bacterium]
MSEMINGQQLFEKPPFEIIEGEKFFMSAARPFPNHITISNKLFCIFYDYIEKNNVKAAAFVECDVYLPDEKNAFIPDFSVFNNLNVINEDKAIHGVPDLVAEVLSRSTMKKDVGIKKDIYERNGVKEYWIINPWAKSIEVYHLIDGKFQLDNVYQIFSEEEYERLEEEERAEVTYEIPVTIFENLLVDVRKVFKWWN